MTAKMNEKESEEEIVRAFQLFAFDDKKVITFENLKHIARELGETMTDDELKLMISEANGGEKTSSVTEEQFAQMLSKATNL
jgi:Ca2+-binding EF-hand superfamily protein